MPDHDSRPAARATPADWAGGVRRRLGGLTSDRAPLWGRMSAHQMLCHLADAFGMAMGERASRRRWNLVTRTVVRGVALHTPLPFPKGFPTLPEIDPTVKGTRPADFEADRAALLERVDAFAARVPELGGRAHPLFGPLSAREWMIWATKHTEHHLRQFGL